jgi:uncharacterized coiled-coil protein SlyX
VGLAAIFSGAFLSVVVMAGILEVGKLVSAAWLHHEWDRVTFLVKTYFITSILVLMFITSMGIFGFLSKAHLEHSISTGGTNELRITNLERQIGNQQRTITDAEKVLSQLDQTVQVLLDADRIRGESGALATRKGQSEERSALNENINAAYDRIEQYQEELTPLTQEKLAIEVEVGPLKYIAELIYGENAKDMFDTAVRGIIIMLVVVFDPLAIMLLVVSVGMFKRDRETMNPLVDEEQIMRMDVANEDPIDWDHAPKGENQEEQKHQGLTTVLKRRPI